MEGSQHDFDRLLFFEHARRTSEVAYAKNPLDAENLTRWAGALLELAGFQERAEAIKYITDAESILEEALEINPRKHDTLWCLGNAYTSHAFSTQDHETAKGYFGKATRYFQDAVNEDPTNELYVKSLELSHKVKFLIELETLTSFSLAPELHLEFQRQVVSQAGAVGGHSASNVKVSEKKKKNKDLKYDILGWVILAVGIIAWVGVAKSHVPPPPGRYFIAFFIGDFFAHPNVHGDLCKDYMVANWRISRFLIWVIQGLYI